MMRNLMTHHIVGAGTFALGVSFCLENYANISLALRTPFMFLEWVPRLSGQHAWGICFIVIGLATLVSWNIYIRAVALAFGALTWGFLAFAGLYESLLGTRATLIGSYAGIVSSVMVVAHLRASAQLPHDFQKRPVPLLGHGD